MKEFKISFCTTCMNRLHHLKRTLQKNVVDNRQYESLEFILLDYNSKDGLEDYVKDNFQEQIQSGRMTYFRTFTPKFYNMSHSRNLAFKLAKGDVVCNIDADNFTGEGFASYVNKEFNENSSIFLNTHNSSVGKSDVFGRICVRKKDFMYVRGYEEKMKHYGFDDLDFINRLKMAGLKNVPIQNIDYLQAVSHSDKERITNGVDDKNLQTLLISYLTPVSSDLLFLFCNEYYKKGTVINNITYPSQRKIKEGKRIVPKYEFSILQDSWIKGRWRKNENLIELMTEKKKTEELHSISNNAYYELKGNRNMKLYYYEISNTYLKEDALFFYNQLSNRLIMEKNLFLKRAVVNSIGFGKDTVFKNFNYDKPITSY